MPPGFDNFEGQRESPLILEQGTESPVRVLNFHFEEDYPFSGYGHDDKPL
jgi:hypothetical protein